MHPVHRIICRAFFAAVALALPAAACAFLPQPVDKAATATAEANFVSQRIEQTLDVDRTATSVAATEEARQLTATANVLATAQAQAQATATAAASATAAAQVAATAQARVTGTAQAQGFAAKVAEYAQAGYLPISQGTYYHLDDYTGDLASKSGLIVHRTGYSPSVFAIRANVTYEVAANAGNFFITGCGFAYWDNGSPDYYSIQSAMDGFVYTRVFVRTRQYDLHKAFNGAPPRPTGTYQVTLIVNQKNGYYLVGDKLVEKMQVIEKSTTSGALSYLVASGIDRDFGTRCAFTNVELWVVE